jgi:hypothetical protein
MQIGDTVIVRFTRGYVFDFQRDLEIMCKLVNIPAGPGDHWIFRHGKYEFTVNPLTPDFVGVFREVR